MANNEKDTEGSRGLRSRVFHILEQNIISGVYPSGMALNEKQLCNEIGVAEIEDCVHYFSPCHKCRLSCQRGGFRYTIFLKTIRLFRIF